MAIKTNLNTSPYWADYDETKRYYMVGFQPGVAVQARELNNLQLQLQKQIERFGDNIFIQGTIVDGCNFQFYNPLPYIKINDILSDGTTAAVPANYVDLNIRSYTTNLVAYVTDYKDGFESSDPNLKTLYLKYVNGGANGSVTEFTAGETCEVYSYQRSVGDFTITNGGIGFSNSDAVVVTSALVVNVTSGSFTNGMYINDGGTANVQIVGIDTTTLLDSGHQIWSIKPRNDDLTNSSITSTAWTIANNSSIADSGATATATVQRILGSGLEAAIRTNATGVVTSVTPTSNGSGYTTVPQITIKSADNPTGVSALDITAKNYKANVVISTLSGAVGNGYGFGVTEGVIYQKGYFQLVEPQKVIVEKYNQSPNGVAVGFETLEELVTSSVDTSLRDNSTGSPNNLAPGADRLKLTPTLVVANTDIAAANTEFFTLVEFSEGRAFRQNRTTQYNKINDEMARRTRDESGNYVVDKFLLSTASPTSNNANSYVIKVDPGTAYVDGYRVATYDVFSKTQQTSPETRSTAHNISLNYGNYVVVDNAVGVFQFSTGDTVSLYDTATSYLSNTQIVEAGTITPSGSSIGTARIRSMVPVNNISPEYSQIGAPDAQYRLYLFDIQMNAGKNFTDTRGIYYNGASYDGIADVVTVTQGTGGTSIAEIAERQKNALLFYSGVDSIQNANNISYIYRNLTQTQTMANTTGSVIYDISAVSDEFFLTTGAMSNAELRKIYMAPVDADLISPTNLTGTLSINTTSPSHKSHQLHIRAA